MEEISNILLRNTKTGEKIFFDTFEKFKINFEEIYNNALICYSKFYKKDEKSFLKALDFNFNAFAETTYKIVDIEYNKKSSSKRKNEKTKSVGNGEGSLYYSETLKKWIYQYYVEGDFKRHTLKQRNKEGVKEFKARVTDLKNKLNTGTYIAKSNDTLYEIIKRHIEQKFKDRILQEVSYLRNLETLEQLNKTCKNFINKPIQKVKVEDIEDAKSNIIEYSQSCIDKMWFLLKKGFQLAYSRRKIPFDIMNDETLLKPVSKKEIKKVRALTITEEQKLRKILDNKEKDHPYRDIVKMQLMTGMRIGEVLARSKDNYNPETKKFLVNNTLTKDKNDKTVLGNHTKTYNKRTGIDIGIRYLPLDFFETEVTTIIVKHINSKITNIYRLIFWDYKHNTFISVAEINSWLDRLNEKYHITNESLSSHVLRHTFVTRLRELGVDTKIIQYIVGHSEGSKITDKVYTSISDEFIEQELRKII